MMEDARTSAARRHFDSWSQTYERDPGSRRLGEAQAAALRLLQLTGVDTLLDVGCGTGAAVRAEARTCRAVGLDLSPGMISQARLRAAGIANVEFLVGDTSGELPFEDAEFSAVVCSTAFHHFPRQAHALAEMVRVLTPGGRVVIADANADRLAVRALDALLRVGQRSHVGFWRPSRIAAALAGLGLAESSITTMWRGNYALVRAQRARSS